ncbi:hypothetical protein [Croceicoccus pelagius]|uniref:Uncharacterized protein n=1 Tax=Croceicoccus pelagius TaxID=1703341 RepID=A0A916YN57_9SPHN|nr:hypothetical protein [Croceicoccus pelagius]GGD53072.1 hypothetical protein GCM10010989_29110 [Croceicoccus pelagius]
MNELNTAPVGAGPRLRAQELLAKYPDLAETEKAELAVIFRKQLSAMDQALIASEEELSVQYATFKRTELNRLTPRDILNAAIFVALTAGPIAGVALYYST